MSEYVTDEEAWAAAHKLLLEAFNALSCIHAQTGAESEALAELQKQINVTVLGLRRFVQEGRDMPLLLEED